MTQLGNGLFDAEEYADALSVREAELAMLRRLGARERNILTVQTNLATSYEMVGQEEQAVHMQGEVYAGTLQLFGEEHEDTLIDANNYASLLVTVKRFEEAKSLLRKTMPVAQRVLGEGHEVTFRMKQVYATALYKDPTATLDDLREAVTTLEDTVRTARRVLGGSHPMVVGIGRELERSRAALAPCPRDAAAAECVNNQQRIVQCRGALSSYANSRRARRRRSAEA